jgi:hypothetical protein
MLLNAWECYENRLSPPLRTRSGERDWNVQLPYGEMIADQGARYLCRGDLPITTGDAGADAALDELWPAEKRSLHILGLASNGAIFGDAWARIVLLNGAPRVQVGDPLNWNADWLDGDIENVRAFAHTYQVEDGDREKTWQERYVRTDEGWEITTAEIDRRGRRAAEGELVVWPFQSPPVYHCQNLYRANDFFGASDLRDKVVKVIANLQLADSLLQKASAAHGVPKTMGLRMAPQDLKISTDGVLFTGNGELRNLETDAAGLQFLLAWRNALRQELFNLAQIPEVLAGKLESIGAISGVALDILFRPLIDLTLTKRRTYGPMIGSLARGLLEVSGYSRALELPVKLHWPEVVPRNVQEAVDVALVKRQAGISTETILIELGYDPAAEAAKLAEERVRLRDAAAADANVGL